MWFKNVQIFELERAPDDESLEAALDGLRAQPPGALELERGGFSAPLGRAAQSLIHSAAGCALLRYTEAKRLLPGQVVAEAIDERVEAIRAAEGREVGRRERSRLKDEVMGELLPRAFVQSSDTEAYVDRQAQLLLVNASTRKRAEKVVSALRRALGSLPVAPPPDAVALRSRLTRALEHDDLPPVLALGDEVELKDPASGGAIARCRRQVLKATEIREHLRAGKQVTLLGLNYCERVQFALAEDGGLRSLKFDDVVLEGLDDDGADAASLLDQQFALLALELRPLLEVVRSLARGAA